MRRIAVLALLMLVPRSLQAQWLNSPTPGVARLADGSPNPIKLELIPDTDLLEWICENNKYIPAQGIGK